MKKLHPTAEFFLVPAGMGIFLVVWQALAQFSNLPSSLFPGPLAVWEIIVSHWNLLAGHSLSTLAITGLGFSISIVLSLILGALLNRSKALGQLAGTLLVISQTIPTLILYPLFLIWLGYGPQSRIVLVILTCFFPVVVNFLQGLKNTPIGQIELFRSLGAGPFLIFWGVQFPSSLPSLFGGLKLSAAYAVIAAVMGEWMGARDGLGVYMARSFKSFRADQVFAGIVLISLYSLLGYKFIEFLEKILLKYKKENL